MSYEKFVPVKKGKVTQKPPVAKVLKGGQISLNSAAYEQYLKGATHLELYYDPSSKKVGLQPKKYKTKAAFKIRAVGKSKSTYRINAKPLIEHYDIKLGEKITVSPSWNSSENLLELSL
ncbi:MAG: hypothetical protein ACETWG_07000 [Candidatus Neomarinimicrobiota bacterium]